MYGRIQGSRLRLKGFGAARRVRGICKVIRVMRIEGRNCGIRILGVG
jgi:hypothetical protein